MIDESDVLTVKLDPVCDVDVPMPKYIKPGCSPVTRAFVVLGDEVVVKALRLNRDVFNAQLEDARLLRASVCGSTADGQRVGVSPQGSKIKQSDNVVDKNLFVPSHLLERLDREINLIFLAYFIRTDPMAYIAEAEVAGWIDLQSVLRIQQANPEQFKSKMRVVSVPCRQLSPMSEFPELVPEVSI